jgi:hypothetical protein
MYIHAQITFTESQDNTPDINSWSVKSSLVVIVCGFDLKCRQTRLTKEEEERGIK